MSGPAAAPGPAGSDPGTLDVRAALAASRDLRGLTPGDLDALVAHAVVEREPAGRLLAHEGAPAAVWWVVVEGVVALEVHHPGRGAVPVGTVGPGEVLGWSWLVSPSRWTVDARVRTPLVAVRLDGPAVRADCSADTGLGWRLASAMTGLLAHRLHAARLALLDLYAHGADR